MASLYSFGVKVVLPLAAAVIVLIVFAVVGYRLVVHTPFAAQGLCAKALGDQRTTESLHQSASEVPFAASEVCVDTGIDLTAGTKYRVAVDRDGEWKDLSHPADIGGLKGFAKRFEWPFLLGFPMRRHLSMPWFTLIGEIGLDTGEIVPINRPSFTFRPASSGRLYLYVNDAINAAALPIPQNEDRTVTSTDWWAYYSNNRGMAVVTVKPLK